MGRRWKRYEEPKLLHNERKMIEERLQQVTSYRGQEDFRYKIGPQRKEGFQPPMGWSHRQIDTRPIRLLQSSQNDRPGPLSVSTSRNHEMEDGESDSRTDQEPSVLELPAINWSRYVGLKSVQYVKMGNVTRIAAEEQND